MAKFERRLLLVDFVDVCVLFGKYLESELEFFFSANIEAKLSHMVYKFLMHWAVVLKVLTHLIFVANVGTIVAK